MKCWQTGVKILNDLVVGGSKAESPLSQGPQPVFVKTLYTLSVCAQTHLPKFPETSLNKGKERYKVNR